MVRRVLIAALALAALAATAPLAHAEPAAQIADASGDARGGDAATDITAVTFAVVHGSNGRGDDRLVVTMSVAAKPAVGNKIRYVVNATTDRCGDLTFSASAHWDGTHGTVFTACTGELIPVPIEQQAGRLVWWVPLWQLPKKVQRGAVLRDFDAYTDVADPVYAIFGTGDTLYQLGYDRHNASQGAAAYDYGSGPGPWVLR